MYLKDDDIIDILKHYIRDERNNQAVLINGEWGSGVLVKQNCNTSV